jgi:hypothetical protein
MKTGPGARIATMCDTLIAEPTVPVGIATDDPL